MAEQKLKRIPEDSYTGSRHKLTRDRHIIFIALIASGCISLGYMPLILDWMNLSVSPVTTYFIGHDIYLLLFPIPVIYAAYRFRLRGVLTVSGVLVGSFIPSITIMPPHLYIFPRVAVFVVFTAVLGSLLASILNKKEQIEAGEWKYRDLVTFLPQALFETDRDLNVTLANPQALSAYGYTDEDLKKGLNGLEMFAPEEREKVLKNAGKVLSGGEGSMGGVKYMARRKDGATFPIVLYVAPIMHGTGVVGMRGVSIDTSRMKR